MVEIRSEGELCKLKLITFMRYDFFDFLQIIKARLSLRLQHCVFGIVGIVLHLQFKVGRL